MYCYVLAVIKAKHSKKQTAHDIVPALYHEKYLFTITQHILT